MRELARRYVQRHRPPLPARSAPPSPPDRKRSAHARALPILRAVPWILTAAFAFSFVWDFDGLRIALFGRTLELEGLLRVLTVSGLIGFLTNWLAVTMLFNPREKRPLVPQGLIPAQRERVAFRLAKAVAEEIINEEIIRARIEQSDLIPRYRRLLVQLTRDVLQDEEFRLEAKHLARDYVDSVLRSPEVRHRIVSFTVRTLEENAHEGLPGFALRTYRFFNEDDFHQRIERAVNNLPDALDEALIHVDPALDRLTETIEERAPAIEAWATAMILRMVEQLDVYHIIYENVSRYDESQLEELLKRTSNEQFNYIKYLGGVLGFVGGFVIWAPEIALPVLAFIVALVWGLDELFYRLRSDHESEEP